MSFSSSACAFPAANIIANSLVKKAVSTPTATLNERGRKGNLIWTSDVAAYTNCCQYTSEFGNHGAFRINLAGWGNTDNTPNVDVTLSQDECAPGLVANIKSRGGKIVDSSWTCVPSYGALGDTYVYFELKKGDSEMVADSLYAIDRISPAWKCLNDLDVYSDKGKACDIQMGNTLKSGKGRR
ncbi:909f8776-d52f-4725-8338-68aedeb0f5a2 [Sclerotinia trifoliorum]|uniref:909f8776-d52f-4725-8338-68aedeb0f5a2 n=1 Tax=Sclerotinia trifoliorum TaxID=28548 RepID=A0A8H2VZ74_9HELO|nr:909f8776-d52f-4725-8338-68aedeb0f5a2 [Sclerotinia trifoliorum]